MTAEERNVLAQLLDAFEHGIHMTDRLSATAIELLDAIGDKLSRAQVNEAMEVFGAAAVRGNEYLELARVARRTFMEGR